MDSIQQLKELYEKTFMDQHVPFCIERNDGALMLLNNDFKTYSFWKQSNGELWNVNDTRSWTLNSLFRKNEEDEFDFKVESWAPIKNLFKHPEKYFTEPSQIKANKRIILNRNENTRTSITWGII